MTKLEPNMEFFQAANTIFYSKQARCLHILKVLHSILSAIYIGNCFCSEREKIMCLLANIVLGKKICFFIVIIARTLSWLYYSSLLITIFPELHIYQVLVILFEIYASLHT